MLASLLLSAALWPSSVTKECTPLDDTIIIGVAKNDVGKTLYCEIISQPHPKTIDISYVRHGKVFAEKKLSYSEEPSKPSVLQTDFRFGEIRQAKVSGKNVELQYLANTKKKIGSASLPVENVDIVDAGFDNFIRTHWDELNAGQMLSVNFASIPHLKTLPLRISVQPIDKCATKHDESSPKVCFYVEIDNAILRILLGNIKLLYDQQRRLYEFNGVVNVQNDDQDNQKAVIHYFYSSDFPTASK